MTRLQELPLSIADLKLGVKGLLKDYFKPNPRSLKKASDVLVKALDKLRDDLCVLVEYPYVDRVYTDTYYSYFATKNSSYSKYSMRLSFFEAPIPDTLSPEYLELVEKSYLGYLTVRPTLPKVIGRSVICPTALKHSDMKVCGAEFDVTVSGVKAVVQGFPHISQDTEKMTCAESTLWSVMEYFGTRYPDYRPILPSEIHNLLDRLSVDRSTPSTGLSAQQFSFALKELGFGVMTYQQTKKVKLKAVIKTYVESGIPVIALIENNDGLKHAVSIIGRMAIGKDLIAKVKTKTLKLRKDGADVSEEESEEGEKEQEGVEVQEFNVCEFTEIQADYVYMDDNLPAYSISSLDDPTRNYDQKLREGKWKGCYISQIVVPLHKKVYLEAVGAMGVLNNSLYGFQKVVNKAPWKKTFLTSSRSFKHAVHLNSQMKKDARGILLGIAMPKFIWVMELSTKKEFEKGMASGLVIIDATEPKDGGFIASMLGGFYHNSEVKDFPLPLQPFKSFANNIKHTSTLRS